MADFNKPGLDGSGRVSTKAWDAFRRTPSPGDRDRRAAVDIVVCLGCGGISGFRRFFSLERTRPAASMRPPCLIYISTITVVRTGSQYSINMSVCLPVYVYPSWFSLGHFCP